MAKKKLRFSKIFAIWLNATSADVITGGQLGLDGGQAHIAFGKSATEVRRFLRASSIRRVSREWSLPVEPYGDIPQSIIPIVENSPRNTRYSECRIPGQSPTSRSRYPLWMRTVIPIPAKSRPRQVLLLIRDTRNHFHVRLFTVDDLHRLPLVVTESLLLFRATGKEHLYEGQGILKDISCPPKQHKAPSPESEVSGSAFGKRRTRPQPKNNSAWKRLAARISKLAKKTPHRRRKTVDAIMRDHGVRKDALSCFGERCQARGCHFTRKLSTMMLRYVLDVHHLKAVAKGGSDALWNLAVLCANHHCLCERPPKVKLVAQRGTDDFMVVYPGGSFLIERDLAPLVRAMERRH